MPKLELHHTHPWRVSPAEARAIQDAMRTKVVSEGALPDDWRTVAGIDVGFEDEGRICKAAVAILDRETLAVAHTAIARLPTAFPYVPGLLSFREIPTVLAALEQLSALPDVIICDGQGYAHPRRFGLACHLGVLLDLPSIGVAKSRLIGVHEEPGLERGDRVPLFAPGGADEVIGAVLRTRRAVSPVYVSVGHRLSLGAAIELTLSCLTRFRLPETTRAAHRLASG